jgi:hypothetical protein
LDRTIQREQGAFNPLKTKQIDKAFRPGPFTTASYCGATGALGPPASSTHAARRETWLLYTNPPSRK